MTIINKKWLLILFLVKVTIPGGSSITYHHVKDAQMGATGLSWNLVLEDGRHAYVPTMWTVIEEEK